MPVQLAIAILLCSISIWIALFGAEFTTQSIILPLLFCSTLLFGLYWLRLKNKNGVGAGPGFPTVVIWFIVTLGGILAWRNDPGDWNLRTFVILHTYFATPVIACGYALWHLMRWLRPRWPYAATLLKMVLLLIPVVIVVIAGGQYVDMLADKPSSIRMSANHDTALGHSNVKPESAPSSVRMSVNHDTALRFGDTVLFGTTSGILGWRISESAHLGRLLEEVPDASIFADMARGRLLLIKSSAGVFCTEWGVRKAFRLSSLPPAKSLFRAGNFAWTISNDGELFKLQSPNETCDDLSVTKVGLGGRKLAAAEIAERSVLFVACKQESLTKEDCRIHQWAKYGSALPEEIGQINGLVSLVAAHGRIWIAGKDDLLELRDGTNSGLSRVKTVGPAITRMILVEDGPWVESASGSWLWSEATSSFRPMRPIARLESYAAIGENRWASSKEGVFRWKPTERNEPFLVTSGVGLVKRFVRWNGCVWLGASNGLFRVCDAFPNRVEHVAKQASSIEDLIVAGWEGRVPPNTRPSSAPDILWAATDLAVLRFSTASPTFPSIVSTETISGRLLAAGDYLWMISADRLSRWRLDASANIEALPFNVGRISRVCTDLTAGWLVGAEGVIRMPDVHSPNFRLDFEDLKKRQFRPDDGSPGDRDARYWNCQDTDPPSFPRSHISRVTMR